MNSSNELLTTTQKALTINLEALRYGVFAEIGAGQEVAREFFHAGGASGTVAKSISAYDMAFSDLIYGKAPRYVSSERLKLMLDHEYNLLLERLDAARGERTSFFVFADTVATSNYKATNEAHGWLGVRFQTHPRSECNEIILHIRMWDKQAALQQQVLGIVGVNLIYGAFYYHDDPNKLIDSLSDTLDHNRIEVDMIRFSGPCFKGVDNRWASLHLVRTGLTNAVMFDSNGNVLQPSEVLYKKAVLVERGSFRPPTHVNVDMINGAKAMFLKEPELQGKDVVTLMEITMNNLLSGGEVEARDFLGRVDLLGDLGFTVLISNYQEYHRLTSYFRRYTKEMIGVAMGVNNLQELFNEKYYENLDGGILEAFGRMFRNSVKLYIYPMWRDAYEEYRARSGANEAPTHNLSSNSIVDAGNITIQGHVADLYEHLRKRQLIESIADFNEAYLNIFSRDVFKKIRNGESGWEDMVPEKVATGIKHLFLDDNRAKGSS